MFEKDDFGSMVTDSPFVSIVLPTYNGSRYLALSIQSCIEQTYPNWELIIVDDASNDATPEIIASFIAKDARIRSVRHETNKKLPGALNTGFSMARGEFLTWTSDDNLYRYQAIETMLDFLQATPEVGLVYTDYSIIDEAGQILREHHVKEPEKLAFGCIVGPCFLYRREVYETVGDYARDMFFVEDYDYWLRTARYFRLVSLPTSLYLYREHGNSLTAQKNIAVQARILQTKSKNMKHIAWVDSNTKTEAFLEMMGVAWSQKNIGLASIYLLSAFHQNPVRVFKKFYKLFG